MSKAWPEILDADFERRLHEIMREWRIPGLAITLVPDDAAIPPIYKILNDEAQTTGPPVTEKTRFPVASCTKLVVALALATALEQNGYDKEFDTRILEILPDFKLSDERATQECTIRDVIGHQTNITGYDFLVTRPWGEGEDVLSVMQDLPLSQPWKQPGFQVYSNAIQHITHPLIERLTQVPFEEYVRRTMIEPLGIDSTGWSVEEAGRDIALGYQARYGPEGIEDRLMEIRCGHDALGEVCGMSSVRMITTIEDVAKLLQHLKENRHFPDMAKPLCDIDASVADGDVLGLEVQGSGTSIIKLGPYIMAGHTGACAGYRSHIMRISELGFGIGVLTNSTEGLDLASWIESWVIGRLTGDETFQDIVHEQIVRLRADLHAERTETWKGIPAVNDRKLVGTFSSPSFGTWTFDENSNLDRRPDGVTIKSIPWLPSLTGKTRPMVVSVGEGIYEGFFEWTPGEGQDYTWGVQYGYTFKVEEHGDCIKVYGIDGWAPNCRALAPAVLYKLQMS